MEADLILSLHRGLGRSVSSKVLMAAADRIRSVRAPASSLTDRDTTTHGLYCKAFSMATEITSASMKGVDRYG